MPMTEALLPTEDRPRLVCGQCGYIHYINPHIVAACLPIENGAVWLLRRGIEPRYSFWTYPAGFQEIDESTEEAAIRETLEELGCHVRLDHLQGVYSHAGASVVIVYMAQLESGSPRPGLSKEAIEVRAFLPADIPWSDLAFPSTEQALRAWVQSLVRGASG